MWSLPRAPAFPRRRARAVRKLEEAGIIEGYTALLNAPALGYDLRRLLHGRPQAPVGSEPCWPRGRDGRMADGAPGLMVSGDSDFPLRGGEPHPLPGFRHRGTIANAQVDTAPC